MTPGKFLTRPGLIPLPDGVNWELDSELSFKLPDGRVIYVPKGFRTDLASIPPLGVVGGVVCALAYALTIFLSAWFSILFLIGFFICVASAYLKPFGKYTLAAVLHDWLFRTHIFPFTMSNWVLLIAMRSEHTARWERFLIWFNVQLFGWSIYKNDRRQKTVRHHAVKIQKL